MKKRILILSALIFSVASLCFGINPSEIAKKFEFVESPEEFGIDFLPIKYMKEKENKEFETIKTSKTYKISKSGASGEVRYSLFKDLGSDQKNDPFIFAQICLRQISGKEKIVREDIKGVKKEDVKNNYGADFGFVSFFKGAKNDYTKGYEFGSAEFYYKNGIGLVMRCYLSNDPDFFGITEDGGFYKNCAVMACNKSFKFKDSPSEKAVAQ